MTQGNAPWLTYEDELDTQMRAGLLRYFSATKYAKYRPEDQRRETFGETISRGEDMHLFRFPQVADEIRRSFDLVRQCRVLPSMRAQQYSGDAILKNNARMFNCVFTHCNRVRAFAEVFWLLLSGCGVAYSVQWHHVNQLPPLAPRLDRSRSVVHVVGDNIAGWGNALLALIRSCVDGYPVVFDYSLIEAGHPKGTPLVTSGGTAPGSAGLRAALECVRRVLMGALGRRLLPIECHDIMCHVSEAVCLGGSRRAALLALFSPNDELMKACKTGNWPEHNRQRRRANNSAALLRSTLTRGKLSEVFTHAKEWGDPGIYLTDNLDWGPNPCVPGDTWVQTSKGPRQVLELVDTPFQARINGRDHASTEAGFFSTGVKAVYEVVTKEGFTFRATSNHQVMRAEVTRKTRHEEWAEVGSLRSGDKVVLHTHQGSAWGGLGTFDDGWLVGSLLGDGSFVTQDAFQTAYLRYWGPTRHYMMNEALRRIRNSESCVTERREYALEGSDIEDKGISQISSVGVRRLAGLYGLHHGNKKVTAGVERASSEFYRGFLSGWFDADGSIQGNQEKGVSVRLASSELGNLEAAQRLLARLGIISKVYKGRRAAGKRRLPDGRGGYKLYFCKEQHELVIAGSNLFMFAEIIGFSEPLKGVQLQGLLESYKRTPNRERFVARVKSITLVGEEEVFDCTVPGPHAFDGNGFMLHNCGEISMNPVYNRGVRGMEAGCSFCNLSETNATLFHSKRDMLEAVEAAAIIGTLQAAYTDFPYLPEVSSLIAQRDALIGVSMTGMLERPDIALNPAYQREAAQLVMDTNVRIARKIGIRPAARATCVKPSGNSSMVLGGISSGHHAHHSAMFVRRSEAYPDDPYYQRFREVNPHMCVAVREDMHLVEWPLRPPPGALVKADTPAVEFLTMVRSTIENWIRPGTREGLGSLGLHHNVSNTALVKPGEWDDVVDYVWENREWFSGVTAFGSDGEIKHPHAPFQAVTDFDGWQHWLDLRKGYKPVNYSSVREFEDNTYFEGESACGGPNGSCEL